MISSLLTLCFMATDSTAQQCCQGSRTIFRSSFTPACCQTVSPTFVGNAPMVNNFSMVANYPSTNCCPTGTSVASSPGYGTPIGSPMCSNYVGGISQPNQTFSTPVVSNYSSPAAMVQSVQMAAPGATAPAESTFVSANPSMNTPITNQTIQGTQAFYSPTVMSSPSYAFNAQPASTFVTPSYTQTNIQLNQTNVSGLRSGFANGLAQMKAQRAANSRVRGHLGGSLGGAQYEGVGWSTVSPQHAVQQCCYWGQKAPLQVGVAQSSDGCWYACVLYR